MALRKILHPPFNFLKNFHLFIYLFIYLVTFTRAEKQAVLGVAQESKAPN